MTVPSADQIYESVREGIPGLSRATVNRAFDRLVVLSVIRRLHHPGAGARFDGTTRRHHHLICGTCNRVIDVDDKQFDNRQELE